MPRIKKRNPSPKQVEANRRNSQKSTGPRTPQGKQQVSLNALKHGLHADPFVQGMLALHEDPRAYYRLLGDLFASLRPANPHQRLQVEDVARLRMEKQRIQRARAALVAGKVRGLERQRDRRQLDFDCEAPDLPQAELLEKGLYRAPDSPPKFEKMLSCFEVLISLAKEGPEPYGSGQGQFQLDPEPELNLLYGKEPSLEGAYLRNVFRRFVATRGSGLGAGDADEETGSEPRTPNPEPRIPDPEGARGVQDPVPNPKSKIPNGVGEPERLLLLRTLFAAKQRALHLYQLYNREFVEITPDQRDACLAPSDRTDVNLMRQEAQNERQLRWALKVYWQTQKEDAARPAPPEGEAGEADELLEALGTLTPSPSPTGRGESKSLEVLPSPTGRGESKSLEVLPSPTGRGGDPSWRVGEGQELTSAISDSEVSNISDAKQSHQVIENTEEVSGIGQNKANFGVGDEQFRIADLQAAVAGFSGIDAQSPIENRKSSIRASIGAVRPKVKELLEQIQSDPEARALVETFLLNQMVEEGSQREEQELAALQRETQKREALEEGLEQMVAAQQELESKNRRLRAQMGASELLHEQVREQVKPAEAAVATRREPTHQEIYQRIREVVGLAGPEEFYSDEAKDIPGYHLGEEEQRRKREEKDQ